MCVTLEVIGRFLQILFLVFFLIVSSNACSSGEECPWHLPFCAQVGCVAKCPEFMYTNGTKCVLTCGDQFVNSNGHCVSSCKEDDYIKSSVKENGQGLFIEKKCVKSCGGNMFLDGRDCLDMCPANLTYIDVVEKTCLSQCPNDKQFITIVNHKGMNFTECREQCHDSSSSKYIYDSTCVDFCPGSMVVSNRSCILNCPDDKPFIQTRNHSRVCVKECFPSQLQFNSSCVSECPTDANYLKGITCSSDPCSEYFYTRSGHITCVSLCKEYDFVYMNECIDHCPENYFVVNRTCVKNCPEVQPLVANITEWSQCYYHYSVSCLERYVNRFNACLSECPPDRFRLNDTCISFCPVPYLTLNNTCVDSCPEKMPIIVENTIKTSVWKYYDNTYSWSYQLQEQKINVCSLECPSKMVIADNMCSKSCPESILFLHGQRCLSDPCPQYFYNMSSHIKCVDRCDNYAFVYKNECLHDCPRDYVVYNGTCTEQCPDNKPLTMNLTSTTSCTSNYYCNRQLIKTFVECFDECPEDRFLLNGSCVPFCPVPYITLNQTCVIECPEDASFVFENNSIPKTWKGPPFFQRVLTSNTFIKVKFCKLECPTDTYIHGNICLKTCPTTHPFIYERHCATECPQNKYITEPHTCSDVCTDPFPYLYNMTCVSKCPGHTKYNFRQTCFKVCPPEAPYINEFAYPDPNSCLKECESNKIDLNGVCTYESECNTSVMILYKRHCLTTCPDDLLWTSEFQTCFPRLTYIIASSIMLLVLLITITCGRIVIWNFLQILCFCCSEKYAETVERKLEESRKISKPRAQINNYMELQEDFDGMDDGCPLVRPNEGSLVEIV